MVSLYERKSESLHIIHKATEHFPPHLHSGMELVYVTCGTLVLGVGCELYSMEKGDFAIVFPNLIHHYQVFGEGKNEAFYLAPQMSMAGYFMDKLQKYCPKNPVIKRENVHPDIRQAIMKLYKEKIRNQILDQAYIQIILARSIPCLELVLRETYESDDVIYQTVNYIAKNFKEEITLDSMAKDLGVSKYAISRVFSSTFHTNFNQYLNEQRLNYAVSLLEYTDMSITDICLEAGFQSQRTFNRVFQEKFKMTPREYKKDFKEKEVIYQMNEESEE
ncbi:AraC family transcriptional regulator [Eisenbergiella porci]|uniref:AraC family transcriptional regulator n=1 Tax=Eisenbergiella porci TaxID=2652274 RepID=UPI002A912A70|nr:AraC family transcriptional regulator [Eisenbergiella porci]MDY5527365.1 AraC family transcriptional regulator [Eisenbergiella porci]